MHRKATRRIFRQGVTGALLALALVVGALLIRHWAAWLVCGLGSLLLVPAASASLLVASRSARGFAGKLRSGESQVAWVHAPEPAPDFAKRGMRLLVVWLSDGDPTHIVGPAAEVEAVVRELRSWTIPPHLTTTDAERAAEETLFKNESSIARSLAKLTGPRPLFDGVPGNRLRAVLRALQPVHRDRPAQAADLEKRLEALTITLMAEETRLGDARRKPQIYSSFSFAKEADTHAEALEAMLPNPPVAPEAVERPHAVIEMDDDDSANDDDTEDNDAEPRT